METIEARVIKVIHQQLDLKGLDINDVKLSASFVGDLGADSLDTVELVMALEEEFGIEIPDSESEKISTVQQAIDHIKAHLGEDK